MQLRFGSRLRSWLFIVCFLLVVIVASVASLTIGWLLPLRKRVVITHATERALSLLLQLLGGISRKIHYADKTALDRFRAAQRPLLIVSNHQSRWETFYLQSLFPPLISVLKRELLYIPLLGWALACYWPVALQRSRSIASVKKIKREGKKRLTKGFNLLIFPQATRLPLGEIGYISSSAAHLGVSSGAILVPVVHNAGKHWPRRNFCLLPGTIDVHVGIPLDCADKTAQQVTAYYQAFFHQHIESQR